MKRILLLVFFVSFSTYSQTLRVGDDSYKAQVLLEGRYGHQKRFDSYGNKKDIAEYEKIYSNGKITEIYVKEYNKYIIDLQTKSNIITKFFFGQGKLKKIIKQFENLDFNYLKKQYDKKYSHRKIGKYYFTEDYKRGSFIKLVDNLSAIEYFSVSGFKIPDNVLDQLKETQNKYETSLSSREQKELDLKKIRTGSFDLQEYNKKYVDSILPYLTSTHIKASKNELRNILKYNGNIVRKSIDNSCELRFYNSENRSFGGSKNRSTGLDFERVNTRNCEIPSKDVRRYLNQYIKIPELLKVYEGKKHIVDTEMFYSFNVVLKRDLIDIKLKKEIKFFSEVSLNNQEKKLIQYALNGQSKGYYKVIYQTGTINGLDASAVYFKKQN